jgi:hypothetical protein
MVRQEELAFVKAIYNLQVSPALLKELRLALSRRKKKPAVPAAVAEAGPRPPNELQVSWRGSAKPTSWQARATPQSPPTGAQQLALGPRLCPRFLQSRANKLLQAAGNSGLPREGRLMRPFWQGPSPRISQVGRSSPQPWIRTRPNPLPLPSQPIGACLTTCPGL